MFDYQRLPKNSKFRLLNSKPSCHRFNDFGDRTRRQAKNGPRNLFVFNHEDIKGM